MSKKIAGGSGWAVVTGASSGLGAIFAQQLAERGMPLVLAGRDEGRLERVRQGILLQRPDAEIELAVGDLASDDGIERLVDALDIREVDVLVNNAGFGTYGP